MKRQEGGLLVIIVSICAHIYTVNASVLIADFTMSRMIELLPRSPYCRLHTDRGDIQRMVLAADSKKIRHVPKESVLALEHVCNEVDEASTEVQGGLGFIYPGTKWCGPGNISTGYDDVGRYAEEDRCCRDHDYCPNFLERGECRRGLCNSGPFVRSHCDCDIRLRRCLQNIQTETANTLGAAFFNVIQVTCFRERRPCSVWQSSDSCPYEFVKPGYYIFNVSTTSRKGFNVPITSQLLSKLANINFSTISKTLRLDDSSTIVVEFDQNATHLSGTEERNLRSESYQLVAKSIFKYLVARPADRILKLIKILQSIPSTVS